MRFIDDEFIKFILDLERRSGRCSNQVKILSVIVRKIYLLESQGNSIANSLVIELLYDLLTDCITEVNDLSIQVEITEKMNDFRVFESVKV